MKSRYVLHRVTVKIPLGLETWKMGRRFPPTSGLMSENFVNPEKWEPCYSLKSKISIETAIFIRLFSLFLCRSNVWF